MANDSFLGEVQIFALGFTPKGWASCNGQILQINQYQALFSLLGNMYGGDGRTTFALPNLNGRVPVGFNSAADISLVLGESGGEETHTLIQNEISSHQHGVNATANFANSKDPAGKVWATTAISAYHPAGDVTMHPMAVSPTGAPQPKPHENRQPYLALNYCIALQGIYPSPN